MKSQLVTQSLAGEWLVHCTAGPALDGDDAARLQEGLPATVPGCIHTDLMAAGLIPDPFVDDNELQVLWVAHSDWEYRLHFVPDALLLQQPSVDLVCEGLDTVAEVLVNGTPVARTQNMFRTWRLPVKALLHGGENTIVVRFRSAPEWCAGFDAVRPLPQANAFFPGAPYLRKAPYHFGWDWGPMLPTVGIWKPIRIEGYATRIADVQIAQAHAAGVVTLDMHVTGAGKAAAGVRVRVSGPDGHTLHAEGAGIDAQASIQIAIAEPQLWWPNGLGTQPLYTIDVALVDADGDTLDQTARTIGLRTIELRQQPDQWGAGFCFVVNGVPVFAKGANWIPADSFPSRMTAERYAHLLGSAAAANMNMIRVWGGGIYEDDHFYRLCDELGLLIWHDFMFSCSVYPFVDPAFVDDVAHEVEDNVRRLRHHACIALWCGNNELEAGWSHWGWSTPERADLEEADSLFFYKTLRTLVASLDPATPYWPGSPSSNLPHTMPQSEATGDAHRWEVWHEVRPFSHFLQQVPRFVSEFGFQSLPPLATIATYAPPEEWNMTSYLMEHHQRNADGNAKMMAYMGAHFRLPGSFPSLVYLTQLLQAEAMRIAIEHWRRQWPRTAGALYWQLDDCWPVASWSSLDSFGRWKALHYVAKRFFAPLHLSIEPGERMSGTVASTGSLGETGAAATVSAIIWLHNDTLDTVEGELRWSLTTLDGVAVRSGVEGVRLAPNAAHAMNRLDFTALFSGPHGQNRRNVVLVGELWVGGERQALSLHTFVPSKHLQLRDPALQGRVAVEGDGSLTVTVKTASLARFVEVSLEGADLVLSDNCFDLPAGDSVTLRGRVPAGWDTGKVTSALRIRSLYDTYQSA